MSFIMVDVEADGPIPGDYSMVCFGAVVVEPSLGKTFYGRLKPISDQWIPEALAGGRADSSQLQEMFPKMVRSDFSITGRAALMLKDLELIHDLARQVGAPMPVTAGVTELFRKMVSDGLGERDNTELVNFYRSGKR